jgi:glutaredoxin
VGKSGFIVYGRDNCPWCDKVKSLLTRAGMDFEYVDLVQNTAERNRLVADGAKSVPQVEFHGSRIGGFEATMNYLSEAGLLV